MPKKRDEEFDLGEFDTNVDPFAEENPEAFSSEENSSSDMEMASPSSGNLPRQSGGVDRKVVNLTSDIPVQIIAVLGKKAITVKDIVSLRMGQVVELNRLPNEAIDLVANGKLIAKGELVEIDGRLGVRILKIFD